MTNPVNAGADIEKELAERHGWKVEGRTLLVMREGQLLPWRNATEHEVKGWAALLAEAGERAKLEARIEGWKKAFGTQTPEETCSLFRAMEIVALRKMLTAEQRNMLTDRRTTLLESDLAAAELRASTEAERARRYAVELNERTITEAEAEDEMRDALARARGLEAQLETARQVCDSIDSLVQYWSKREIESPANHMEFARESQYQLQAWNKLRAALSQLATPSAEP